MKCKIVTKQKHCSNFATKQKHCSSFVLSYRNIITKPPLEFMQKHKQTVPEADTTKMATKKLIGYLHFISLTPTPI